MMHVPYEQKGNTVTINPRNSVTRRQVPVDEFRRMASGALDLTVGDLVLYNGNLDEIECVQSFDSVKLKRRGYVSPTKLTRLSPSTIPEPSGRNTVYDTTTDKGNEPLTLALFLSTVIIAAAYGVAYLLGV
jgi:hypothetical protein